MTNDIKINRSIGKEGNTIGFFVNIKITCDNEKAGQCSTIYAHFNSKLKGISQDVPLAHISFRNARRVYKAGEGWTLPDTQEFIILDGYSKDIVADGIESFSHAKEVAFDYVTALLTDAEWIFNWNNINGNAIK